MSIEYLEWDTSFFGIKTGKAEVFDESGFDPVGFRQRALEENYKLVYVFKYDKMFPKQTIDMADIELVDIMLKMSMNFNKKDFLNIPYDFRQNLLPEELLDCYLIAEQTSSVSRFANEPKIGQEKTKKLYRKWVDNVVNKTFADGLFLEKDNNSVQGIHIIKTDFIKKIGCFSLTGVRSDLKGLGIGKRLWLQSFAYWANETETNKIMTSFSFKNAESFNFHLKMGFNKTDEVKYIYHFRNHNKL